MIVPNRRGFVTSLLAASAALGAGALAFPAAGQQSVVIGGGPAGAAAALALRRAQSRGSVLLVERDPARLAPSRPAEAFGQPGAGIDLAALRAAGVEVVLDEVVRIDWTAARLDLFSGRRPGFDRLLLAPGTAPRAEAIPGLDARARHLWPAAWGSAREARRLAAQLSALPDAGHVVLRLPAGPIAQPDAALTRALDLAAHITRHRPAARLTVLDGSDQPALAEAFQQRAAESGLARVADWRRPAEGGIVLRIDAGRGVLETTAGQIRADVVNFLQPQGAGKIARIAGLADDSGWCPCDARARSTLRPEAVVLGDARKGARRTVDGALNSVRASALARTA